MAVCLTSAFAQAVDRRAMGTQERDQTVGNGAELDRRREPRVDVAKRITAVITPANVPILILNISDGGCLMRSLVQYQPDQTLELRVTIAESNPLLLRARVVHTLRASVGDATSYITGLEFVDRGNPSVDQALATLFSVLD